MIIKSMSRKEPSFAQLFAYMSDEKSDRTFDIHQGLFSRDPKDITAEFEANSQLLNKRKDGNFLLHEVLSIDTRECGQDRDVREKLRLLALEYIDRRCPRNIVYGALHRDHDAHLHYHLMISANERGERKRQRMTPNQFATKKREMEAHARETYPELKQDRVMDVTNEERDARRQTVRDSRKVQEIKKRGGRLTKKEQLAQEMRSLFSYAASQDELEQLLTAKGFTFYENGKYCGIRPIPEEGATKKPRSQRFATIGVAEDYAAFLERVAPAKEAGRKSDAGEAEKAAAGEKDKEATEKTHGPERESEPDRGEQQSSTDQQRESGQQEPRQSTEKSQFAKDMEDIYARKKEQQVRKRLRKLSRKGKPRSR